MLAPFCCTLCRRNSRPLTAPGNSWPCTYKVSASFCTSNLRPMPGLFSASGLFTTPRRLTLTPRKGCLLPVAVLHMQPCPHCQVRVVRTAAVFMLPSVATLPSLTFSFTAMALPDTATRVRHTGASTACVAMLLGASCSFGAQGPEQQRHGLQFSHFVVQASVLTSRRHADAVRACALRNERSSTMARIANASSK
jgi:hypothetical protein